MLAVTQMGPLLGDVRMPKDPSGQAKGIAFCDFCDAASAAYAITVLDGLLIGGRALRVNISDRSAPVAGLGRNAAPAAPLVWSSRSESTQGVGGTQAAPERTAGEGRHARQESGGSDQQHEDEDSSHRRDGRRGGSRERRVVGSYPPISHGQIDRHRGEERQSDRDRGEERQSDRHRGEERQSRLGLDEERSSRRDYRDCRDYRDHHEDSREGRGEWRGCGGGRRTRDPRDERWDPHEERWDPNGERWRPPPGSRIDRDDRVWNGDDRGRGVRREDSRDRREGWRGNSRDR